MGENLNQWIRRMLKEKGWSMRELGRRSGLDPSTISRVLSGKTKPTGDFYYGISKAFGVTTESIERLDIEGIEPGDIGSLDEKMTLREAYDIMKRLSTEDQKELIRYAWYLLTRKDVSGFSGDEEGGKDKSAKE